MRNLQTNVGCCGVGFCRLVNNAGRSKCNMDGCPRIPPVRAFARLSIHWPGGQFLFQIVRPQYALFVERLFQVLYQGWRRPCAFDLSLRPSVTNPRRLNCEESLFARGHSFGRALTASSLQQSKPHCPREDSTTTSANEPMTWASECDLIWSVATRATS
jgi:hypothetical protein